MEVAKQWDADLYPELETAGGLAHALTRVLPGQLVPTGHGPPLVYARVAHGSRSSQVMVGAKTRAFSVDFWNQGVQYAHGFAATLEDVGRAFVAFQLERISTDAMALVFPWFGANKQAAVHESGPSAFVEYAWERTHRWLSQTEPEESVMRQLFPLVEAAMAVPALRSLFPFTSLNNLCFSRTTGYPYTSDCPSASPVQHGRFRARGGKLGAEPTKSVEGDEATIARVLAEALPDGCGLAVHGTADDFAAR